MAQKDNYDIILEEMLDLAGVPLDEAEDNDAEAFKTAAKDVIDEPEDSDEPKSSSDNDSEAEGELEDSWEKEFRTGSKFKIQIHDNYIYVWYRNKRSQKIKVPPKLKPYRALYSSLFEKILAHVQKAS